MPTAADIRTKIEQLQADRAALEARQDEITSEIAHRWHEDNATLEAEFSAIVGRLKAADKVHQQLERDLERAITDELLAQHQQAHQELQALVVVRDEAQVKRDKAEKRFEQLAAEASAANRTVTSASSRLTQIEHDLERRGISRAALYAQMEQSA